MAIRFIISGLEEAEVASVFLFLQGCLNSGSRASGQPEEGSCGVMDCSGIGLWLRLEWCKTCIRSIEWVFVFGTGDCQSFDSPFWLKSVLRQYFII
ncbi:hypothetical protein D0S45_19355 [Marinifilum sp. JC120]|nr:hypothetical protein D0S45_19355 [Marinifilum sp. JC120]